MKRICSIAFLFLIAFCVHAQDTNKIEALIKKLGAPSFKERNEAAKALLVIGLPAKAALEKAAKGQDPEVRARAAEVLLDVIAGVNPKWAKATREKVRGFDKLSHADRKKLMGHLVERHGMESLPFLFLQVKKGDKTDAPEAQTLIGKLPDKKAVMTAILARCREPVNRYEGALLVTAVEWSKDPDHIALAFKSKHVSSQWRSKLHKTAIKKVQHLYQDAEYAKVVALAGSYAKAVPTDSRFMYLQSLALSQLGKMKAGAEMAETALKTNPKSESGHYQAGTMLLDLGYFDMSEKEWKKILEIPPKDGVYDLNAYMRLGKIYGETNRYAQAAKMYETGLAKYKAAKEKRGSGMGMVGLEHLPGMIQRYKELARKAEADAKKKADPARMVKVTIIPVVKKGKGAELARVLKETAFSMTSSVEPHGFRLFEKAAAKLAYDHKKQEISIVLNGKSCGQAQKCKLEEEESIVALHMLDMTYIFSINRDTGQAKKLASYERDYKLKISRGATVLKWADSAIKINDKKHDWQESEEGIPYDYLPKKLNLEISGTTEDGKKVALKTSANPAAFIKR